MNYDHDIFHKSYDLIPIIHMYMFSYREVNNGSDDEGPIATEMSIGDISAQDRGDPDGADPVGHVV